MFTQDHRADFGAVLEHQEPFALIRFGDGEAALIDGVAHRSADTWETTGPSWLQRELRDTLFSDMSRFCMGLPTPCCFPSGMRLTQVSGAPRSHQTFATLFMHANLPRGNHLQEHFPQAVVVNDRYGDIKIPSDGVSTPWDLDAVVSQLQRVTSGPILLAAGPCSNILAYRYWQRQPVSKRVSIIDVGSTLDVLDGRWSRHYHGKMNDHTCQWASSRSRSPGRQRDRTVATERIRVGRTQPKCTAPKLRVSKRIRLGKP